MEKPNQHIEKVRERIAQISHKLHGGEKGTKPCRVCYLLADAVLSDPDILIRDPDQSLPKYQHSHNNGIGTGYIHSHRRGNIPHGHHGSKYGGKQSAV